MPKQYPDEIKKQVVLSYQNGILIPNLSRRSQISQSTLCRWMNEVFSIKIFIENYAAQRTELNQKKRTIDKTPPDVGKWKYYIGGYFNGEEI